MRARRFAMLAAWLALIPSDPLLGQSATRVALVPFSSNAALQEYLREASAATVRHVALEQASRCPVRFDASVEQDAAAGPVVIEGVVRDRQTDRPIVESAVVVLGTTRGAMTDSSGRYRIEIPDQAVTAPREVSLQVRRIGYRSAVSSLMIRPGRRLSVAVSICPSPTWHWDRIRFGWTGFVNQLSAPPDDEAPSVRVGRHLILLQDGRLNTIDVDGDRLRVVSSVNAYGAAVDTAGRRLDKVLVLDRTIVVAGYNSEQRSVELGVFSISRAGLLQYQRTYSLHTTDFSTRNYAARVAGDRLVLYTPILLGSDTLALHRAFRLTHEWRESPDTASPVPFAIPRSVYRSVDTADGRFVDVAHALLSCGADDGRLTCHGSAVVGGRPSAFHLSQSAAYVAFRASSMDSPGGRLLRLPFDGSVPGLLHLPGVPIDHFAFEERRDTLRVMLLGAESRTSVPDVMPSPASLALATIPHSEFDVPAVPMSPALGIRLRVVPSPISGEAPLPVLTTRFGERHVLVGGAGAGSSDTDSSTLIVVPTDSGAAAVVTVPHPVERIAVVGADAVIAGNTSAAMHVTSVRLGAAPTMGATHRWVELSHGDTRSRDLGVGPDQRAPGVFDLTIPVSQSDGPGWWNGIRVATAVLYLRYDQGVFRELGLVGASRPCDRRDPDFQICARRFGMTGALAVHGRILARVGNEVVESRMAGLRLVERRRARVVPPATDSLPPDR